MHIREAIGDGTLEILIDGNRISQHQRELLERPENYLRPIRIREYSRPPDLDDQKLTTESETAIAAATR